MSTQSPEDGPSLARIMLARREQLAFRLALAAAVGLIFQVLTGWLASLVWFLAYLAIQLAEFRLFRHVTPDLDLRPGERARAAAAIALGTLVFSSIGLVEACYAGAWGFASASLLWSGAILNGAMISGGSRLALKASILPPALYFLSAPVFVFLGGANPVYGLVVVGAAAVNTGAAITIWSNSRSLLDARAAERQATHIALHDPETDLPNRLAFERAICGRLAQDAPDRHFVAAIGVDRFAELRGAIGYGPFAELIAKTAERLAAAFPEEPIARLSTDIVGLAFEAENAEAAHRRAGEILGLLNKPVQLGATSVDLTLTIGLAPGAAEPGMPASPVERANIALDMARARVRRVALFDPAAYGDPSRRLSLMSEMLGALSNGEMALAYQPKADLRHGTYAGAEALLRWAHPTTGPISPDQFVPMAEETGHIEELTLWTIAEAIYAQEKLYEAGHRLTIAVNLSARLAGNAEFAERALSLIRKSGADLRLEITETAIMENSDAALEVVSRFRQAGISIAIDDYGSGYSSLAYLKRIPASELKIDKAFITEMTGASRNVFLVRSTIDLAHGLGLEVTAEGIEEEETLALLTGMGCDHAQGFVIGRPMPLERLIAFLDAERERRSPPTRAARAGE